MNTQKLLPLVFISLLAVGLAGLAAGCTLDFDDFETPADAPDAGDVEDAAPDDTGPANDTDPDAQTDADVPDEPGTLGAPCDDADDCIGDVCRGSVCLAECDDDGDCPSGADCLQIGSEHFCAPRCRDLGGCDHLDVNDDLSCTYVVESRQFGASPHRLSRACLTDSADDGVFDGIDNCPDEPNAPQADSTGDGVGDVCADEPYCHTDADDGILEYDAVDFRPGSFVTPEVVDDRWLPIVGTVDDDGSPDSPLVLLDRHSGQWHEKAPLEFPGADRYVVPTNTGGFLISPGSEPGADSDGEWTRLSPEGQIGYGPEYTPVDDGDPWVTMLGVSDDYTPATAPLRFSNGAVEHLIFGIEPLVSTSSDDSQWLRVGAFERRAGLDSFGSLRQFDRLDGTDGDPVEFDEFDAESIQTLAHPDGTAGAAMWHADSSTLYLADATTPPGAPHDELSLQELEIPDQWYDGTGESQAESCDLVTDCEDDEICLDDQACVDAEDGCLDDGDCEDGETCFADVCTETDDIEDLSQFDPAAVPAPGGQLYVFDKNTGMAGRFVAERHEDADEDEALLFERHWGNFERIPEYDLPDFEDFDDPQVYVLPDARGVGLVGAPAADGEDEDPPEQLQVRELYFDCLAMTDDVDTAGDGVGEFVDNCPGLDNPDQRDLDGDAWGDACDPDIDGDGIPNELDYIEVEDDNGDSDDNGDDDNGDGNNGDDDNGDGNNGDDDRIDASMDTDNDGTPNDEDDDIDGDGIPTQYDPFPFDSSNDGTPNLWTDDASANGFTDQQLRDAGLDPYDFFSLPVEQQFYYLVDDDGERSLYGASLDAPDDATQLDVDGYDPHGLTFGDDMIYFLDGPPGQTHWIAGYDLAEDTVTFTLDFAESPSDDDQEVPMNIRSLSWVDTDHVDWWDSDDHVHVVVHEKLEGDNWTISELQETSGGHHAEPIEPVSDVFDHFWYAHLHEADDQEILFFIAAQSDCIECASAYMYWFDDDVIELVDDFGTGFGAAGGFGGSVLFEAPATANNDHRIHHLAPQRSLRYSTDVGPDYDQLTGLTEARYLDEFDGEPIIAHTAARWDQSSDLWMYVPTAPYREDRWQPLITDEASIVDVVWQP